MGPIFEWLGSCAGSESPWSMHTERYLHCSRAEKSTRAQEHQTRHEDKDGDSIRVMTCIAFNDTSCMLTCWRVESGDQPLQLHMRLRKIARVVQKRPITMLYTVESVTYISLLRSISSTETIRCKCLCTDSQLPSKRASSLGNAINRGVVTRSIIHQRHGDTVRAIARHRRSLRMTAMTTFGEGGHKGAHNCHKHHSTCRVTRHPNDRRRRRTARR